MAVSSAAVPLMLWLDIYSIDGLLAGGSGSPASSIFLGAVGLFAALYLGLARGFRMSELEAWTGRLRRR